MMVCELRMETFVYLRGKQSLFKRSKLGSSRQFFIFFQHILTVQIGATFSLMI